MNVFRTVVLAWMFFLTLSLGLFFSYYRSHIIRQFPRLVNDVNYSRSRVEQLEFLVDKIYQKHPELME